MLGMLELLGERLAALEEEYFEKPVRILVLRDRRITLPSGALELRKGEEIDVPRRVALALVDEGVAEIRDQGLSLEELARIHFTETNTRSPLEIPRLPRDFYMQAREYLERLDERLSAKVDPEAYEERRKAERFIYEIVAHRLGLILRLLQGGRKPGEIADRLLPEEQALYEALQEVLNEWRGRVVGYLG